MSHPYFKLVDMLFLPRDYHLFASVDYMLTWRLIVCVGTYMHVYIVMH